MKKLIVLLNFTFGIFNFTFSQTSGGPDLFGYSWKNSSNPGGPFYNWIDIDNLPNTIPVIGLTDDNMVGPLDIQIPFEFYGYRPPQFWISSNGSISFNGNNQFGVPLFPIPTLPPAQQNFIAPMLTDLTFVDSLAQPIAGATCKYWVSPANDSLVITWDSVPFWDIVFPHYSGVNSFQVVLSSTDNSITFQYKIQDGIYSMAGNFLSTGVQNNLGTAGLQVLFDAYPAANTAVKISVADHNIISGTAYVDLNSNSIKDTNENPIDNLTIFEQSTGRMAVSLSNGTYGLLVFNTGNYTTYASSTSNYYSFNPPSNTSTFNGINQVDSLNNFAYQPTITANDLSVTAFSGMGFRPGFNSSYHVHYKNEGTTSLAGTIIFYPDDDITYISSPLLPTSITADSVTWNIPQLNPFDNGSFDIIVNVNSSAPMGALVNSHFIIEPVNGDYNPSNNHSTWEYFVTSSFDPNDILVNQDSLITTQISNPPYLDYVIRFQNTGNDTAFNVSIINNITQKLNISTFELIESSHSIKVEYLQLTRDLKFKFENILLPDSNTNEPLSHGFVHYRIKPKTTLLAGDSIINNAYIHFDFNAPVATNTAVTKIVLPTGVPDVRFDNYDLTIFPNPAKDEITITGYALQNNQSVVLKIYDVMGKEVFSQSNINRTSQIIDLKSFTNGVYFVQLQTGAMVSRVKFIKQ